MLLVMGHANTVELNGSNTKHENTCMFETGAIQVNECYSLCQVKRHNGDIFSIFLNMKVCLCVLIRIASSRQV